MCGMAKGDGKKKRQPDNDESLPSGSIRVRVYAGIDPVTNTARYLRETVHPGPDQKREVERVKAEFVAQVRTQRHPRTDATVQQLIDQHLGDAKLGFKTRINYRSQAEKHIIPCIGRQKVRAVDARVTDSFYSELRRCRDHCNGRPQVQHRTTQQHDCGERCRPHVCKPLSESSILYIYQILSGAFRRAVRPEVGVGQPNRLRRAAGGAENEPSASVGG
jgi:hypothetical protein